MLSAVGKFMGKVTVSCGNVGLPTYSLTYSVLNPTLRMRKLKEGGGMLPSPPFLSLGYKSLLVRGIPLGSKGRKGKVVPVNAMDALGRRGGIAPTLS
jgi:hypothetical protein